jgi:Rrf2 family protein
MGLSQKCQYGLRAIFELAVRDGQGPTAISQIAEAQAIPARFLEQIVGQLKQAGYVESRRGIQGGYTLAVSPRLLTVGEIIKFLEGPLSPVKCIGAQGERECPLRGNCAFKKMWKKAEQAASAVYDSTTFQDLVDEHRASSEKFALTYNI